MLLTKVLMSLPEEYGFFHCAWESTTENQKTLENLTLRLKTEELRLRAEEKPIALATSSKSKADKNDRLCFYCKKPGHVKKNCFKYKAKMSGEKKDGNTGRQSEAMTSISGGQSSLDEESWFLDSGASDHMTKHFEWFSVYEKFSVATDVKVGNGSYIKTYGRGRVDILSYVGNKEVKCHLENVMYVPDIALNLM